MRAVHCPRPALSTETSRRGMLNNLSGQGRSTACALTAEGRGPLFGPRFPYGVVC
jgi:hypothetical protein